MTPTQKQKIRAAITDYCVRAENNRLRWAYSERRPYNGLGVAPDHDHIDDCSAYCALAFYWAMHHTGLILADPLGMHYSGYGWTGSQYDYLKAHHAPVDKYLVGDMAIFGTNPPGGTIHTTICRKAGTARTAIFSSNGRQGFVISNDAPEPTVLADHRQPLIGVYRHPSLV